VRVRVDRSMLLHAAADADGEHADAPPHANGCGMRVCKRMTKRVMVSVRQMTAHDCERVAEVTGASVRWLADQERWNEAQLAYMLADQTSPETIGHLSATQQWLVACLGNLVVGVVSVCRDDIGRLFVDPAYHRRGVGTALFEAAERSVRDAGFGEMRVRSTPSSAPFYERMGMRTTAREPRRCEEFAGRELLIMTKRL
jgi:GNAT superfamily N-acetyltransferase